MLTLQEINSQLQEARAEGRKENLRRLLNMSRPEMQSPEAFQEFVRRGGGVDAKEVWPGK